MAVVNLVCMRRIRISLLFITCIVLCFVLNSPECLWINRWILVRIWCSYCYSTQIRITLFLSNRLAEIGLSLNIGCIAFTSRLFWVGFTWTVSQQRAVIGLVILNCNCLVFERYLLLEILRSTVVVIVVEAIN